MPANTTNIILLLTGWTIFFTIHSLLASIGVKKAVMNRHPKFAPWYRLSYNIVSLLLLIPVLMFSHSINSPVLWQWKGFMKIISTIIGLAAAAGFIFTLRYYDTSEFMGTKQLREKNADPEGEGHFTLSPLHRYVRHPWYFLAIVIIWTRDMDLVFLTTATAATAYFIIGSRLEEQKLIVYYGEKYKKYMAAVPGLIPRPWRHLTEEGAKCLLKE